MGYTRDMSQGGVGVPDPNIRASDADRERVVEQLRQHTADGRLTMDEFEQRMSAAYEARTYAELAQLTRDLPVDLGTRGARGFGTPGAAYPQDAPPASAGWSSHSSGDRSQGWPLGGRVGGSGGTGSGTGVGPVVGDVASALVNAAMDFKMHKSAQRQAAMERHAAMTAERNRRHDVRINRHHGGAAAVFASWASLSVLLTGIWFISGVTDTNGFGAFWPIWPIGILGLLALSRVIRTFGNRR